MVSPQNFVRYTPVQLKSMERKIELLESGRPIHADLLRGRLRNSKTNGVRGVAFVVAHVKFENLSEWCSYHSRTQ